MLAQLSTVAHSPTHSLTHTHILLTHPLACLFTHLLSRLLPTCLLVHHSPTHPLVHSATHSLTGLLACSLIHPLTCSHTLHSPTRLLVYPFTLILSPTCSLTNPLHSLARLLDSTHYSLLVHSLITHLFSHLLTRSLACSFAHLFNHPYARSLTVLLLVPTHPLAVSLIRLFAYPAISHPTAHPLIGLPTHFFSHRLH